MGYRDMIRKLSQRFGENKPFKDDKLIDELVTVTGYPQVKDFYNKYIAGNQPTPYAEYLNMVGIEAKKKDTPPLFWFIKDPNQTGYNDKNNTFVFDESSALSPFAKSVGFKITDEIVALDGKTIDIRKVQEFIGYTKTIKEGQDVTVTILRKNGDKTDKMDLKGKAILDKMTIESLQYKASPTPAELKLQTHWLTGKK
jgi:predicted metalloprotease with PDZ domain